MTRLALLVVVVAGFGCSKPTEGDCRKAIANMQRLLGTDNMRDEGRLESEVRRCKGGSKKAAVDCAIKAQTLDDLRHCEFFKVPEHAPGLGPSGSAATGSGSAAGSAAPDPGSAAGSAPGSAATGSAATGTGSASGSAATGSAMTPGTAAGSAATTPGGAVGSAK